jgi:hypothetical protein
MRYNRSEALYYPSNQQVGASAQSASVPVQVQLLGADGRGRHAYEQFIHRAYSAAYGADLTQFMPTLMGLRAADGQLLAALGYRAASEGPLFLETYLEQPIETVLSARLAAFGTDITRDQVVEVGNLATVSSGGARWLIIALTAYLQGAGYDWVVFTAVRSLRNSFEKLGLKLIPLGPARQDRLTAEAVAQWGSYYDAAPQVVAVNVHHTYGVLDRYLRLEQTVRVLCRLWQRAYVAGAAKLAGSIRGVPFGSLLAETK